MAAMRHLSPTSRPATRALTEPPPPEAEWMEGKFPIKVAQEAAGRGLVGVEGRGLVGVEGRGLVGGAGRGLGGVVGWGLGVGTWRMVQRTQKGTDKPKQAEGMGNAKRTGPSP